MAKTTFSDGNQSQGTLGTRVTAAFLNAINNHRHTGADEDGHGALDYAAATGSANVYAVTLSPALSAYVTGMPISFLANFTNTGPATLNVNGLGAKSIQHHSLALDAGDIQGGQIATVIYDGTGFQMVNAKRSAQVPAGIVEWMAASTAPVGWLKCNGANVSRTAYAALFAAVGTTFGAGNGTTTFNLPDLRSEFIRGWDDGRGVDSGRTFGSAQADALESHTHTVRLRSCGSGSASNSLQGSTQVPYTDQDFTTAATGGTETRPRNVALLPCIKY
ncbi:MAG: tail fiber protein [Deltaproteobacteria bacterium]|nr:tail fiber protein [Deltaproteobacteria bacterium]